jgi:ubiquinone/menaquinone biosynthesis C-methylase UbiE
MIKRTPAFKPPRKERTVRPSLSYKPKSAPTGGYSEERAKPRSVRHKKPSSTYARQKIDPNFEKRRPVMKDTQKTRYKIPTSPKSSDVVPKDTSWGGVAAWYDKHLEKTDTYHEKVVHPNLLRLVGDVKGKQFVDLACGQGIFSRLLADKGAHVVGVDLGKELITIAEKMNVNHTFAIHYYNSSADELYMVKDATKDVVVCVLALQNIENLQGAFAEASRVLKKGGTLIAVLNHPAFRIPRESAWGYDEHEKTQYRRIDAYLSESKIKIDMTPGAIKDKKFTVSFHRPLQVYMKALSKYGFAITRLEEWGSHRASQAGPRKEAEDRARKEIPLFLAFEATKL